MEKEIESRENKEIGERAVETLPDNFFFFEMKELIKAN